MNMNVFYLQYFHFHSQSCACECLSLIWTTGFQWNLNDTLMAKTAVVVPCAFHINHVCVFTSSFYLWSSLNLPWCLAETAPNINNPPIAFVFYLKQVLSACHHCWSCASFILFSHTTPRSFCVLVEAQALLSGSPFFFFFPDNTSKHPPS